MPGQVEEVLVSEPWGLSAPESEEDRTIALPLKQRIVMCPTLIVEHVEQRYRTCLVPYRTRQCHTGHAYCWV